jgi:hypothetical protein
MMNRGYPALMSFLIFFAQLHLPCSGQVRSGYDPDSNTVRISDHEGNLVLNVNCRNRCVIDHVEALGRVVVSNRKGVFSSVKCNGTVCSTNSEIPSPKVITEGDQTIIDGITFGENESRISEKWIFSSGSGYIDWTIERSYKEDITLEDTGFPEWSFDSMETWTGALLGTGGVAWCRFFDKVNASLGNHTGDVTFWNQENSACLRIEPSQNDLQHIAVRFSRQPDNLFTLNYSVSEAELRTKHFLSRFIIDRQDIWDLFDARGTVRVTYRLRALKYEEAFDRGDFPGFDKKSIQGVLNTIARVGVIDEKLMGSNNWHLDMGFVCLHEPWIAMMGLAINDTHYLDNYRKSLDYYRDNAISPSGDVKDRWACRIWDSKPGTYDNGFYETQWGDLLDANTDYVINVAGLFALNGDLRWVRTHKLQCEKALGFLLGRDSDNNGLIEVLTSSHNEKRGSDWIDVIWASWETAFINAKLYEALIKWSDVEEITGDSFRADYYRYLAKKCKNSFNEPVSKGGFWSPENNWYVYWRDKDGSVHGDNLVTPVNFMAIASGICDSKERQEAILGKIESLMQKEDLFMWPINFFPYRADEGYKVNYPFPAYENGDIFLAWGEAGIRAYENYDPSIPVKYVKNVLNQYKKDGLAFQRYDRERQEGQGNDILANNCLPVVGLFRDIYGIEPEYNRLCLAPHLTKELNGTRIKYRLRDRNYIIQLSENNYSVNVNSFSLYSPDNFGIDIENNKLHYFNGSDASPSLTVWRDRESELIVKIISWNNVSKGVRKWTILSTTEPLFNDYGVNRLKAGTSFRISKNGGFYINVTSDSTGTIHFNSLAKPGVETLFEIREAE